GAQSTNNPTQQQIATLLQNAMLAVFGTPNMTTFQVWDFMQGHVDFTPLSYLIDSSGNLTPAGQVWQQMLGIHNWGLSGVPFWGMNTTLTADANGQITFNGFLGNYSFNDGSGPVSLDMTHSGSFTVSLANAAPTVATGAAANPSPVSGTAANLSALGAD